MAAGERDTTVTSPGSPFAISGHYSHHNEQHDFVAEKTGEGLLIHGVQLLGYVSMILPPSPAVDSAQFLAKGGAGAK